MNEQAIGLGLVFRVGKSFRDRGGMRLLTAGSGRSCSPGSPRTIFEVEDP
jgi:hypothetical protein